MATVRSINDQNGILALMFRGGRAWLSCLAHPFSLFVFFLITASLTTLAQIPGSEDPGERAWAEIQRVAQSDEGYSPDDAARIRLAAKLEALVQNFLKKFPKHEKATDARDMQEELLSYLAALGSKAHQRTLEARETARLNNPKTSQAERLDIQFEQISRKAFAMTKSGKYTTAAYIETELKPLREKAKKGSVAFKAEELLSYAARISPPERARAICQEILARDSESTRKTATELLQQLELLGKPLALQFEALDGRKVDLAEMKGKVVIIHFWATWCPPCVQEVLETKPVYDKLHPEGLEVVGISFDEKKEKLEAFLQRWQLPWPQAFEGKPRDNTLGKTFHVRGGVPTLWIVDKKGILRFLNEGNKLSETVSTLLRE